jgi:hypothetical protein
MASPANLRPRYGTFTVPSLKYAGYASRLTQVDILSHARNMGL